MVRGNPILVDVWPRGPRGFAGLGLERLSVFLVSNFENLEESRNWFSLADFDSIPRVGDSTILLRSLRWPCENWPKISDRTEHPSHARNSHCSHISLKRSVPGSSRVLPSFSVCTPGKLSTEAPKATKVVQPRENKHFRVYKVHYDSSKESLKPGPFDTVPTGENDFKHLFEGAEDRVDVEQSDELESGGADELGDGLDGSDDASDPSLDDEDDLALLDSDELCKPEDFEDEVLCGIRKAPNIAQLAAKRNPSRSTRRARRAEMRRLTGANRHTEQIRKAFLRSRGHVCLEWTRMTFVGGLHRRGV